MVSVERHSERVMTVKLVIDNGPLNVLTAVSYTHLTLPTNREV